MMQPRPAGLYAHRNDSDSLKNDKDPFVIGRRKPIPTRSKKHLHGEYIDQYHQDREERDAINEYHRDGRDGGL